MAKSISSTACSFTLVELLVVIDIIAVSFFSILLPPLARARQQALTVSVWPTCASLGRRS